MAIELRFDKYNKDISWFNFNHTPVNGWKRNFRAWKRNFRAWKRNFRADN